MSADDDDDFWANEDFIATIENVVKKAEEASAARHCGTQSTPRFSAIPPQRDNDRIGGTAGPSTHCTPHGTPHVPEFPSSRRNDGSLRNYGPSLLTEEVREDLHTTHQSLQELSISVLPQGGADGVREDSARYGQLMAEKDRTISVLRSRVQEAEEHLDDFRKRVGSQNASQPAFYQQNYQQQLELQRLSAQLMFKDHEIIEAQRARTEKEERLKHALAETVALKEELEKLKKSRQTGAAFKRPWSEASMDVLEKKVDCCGDAMIFPYAGEEGDLLTTNEVSRIMESPKMRTGGNGFVNMDGKESTKSDKLQANECHKGDMLGRAGTSMPWRSDEEELPSIEQLKSISRTSDMYYSLQHLWGLKGVRNDGVSLLSKLYASCGQDLYVLFSNGESQVVKNLRSTDRGKEGRPESGTISEKLHTALGKVTNGLAHPEVIITPLLEFCKLENVNLVGRALHILRYILHHDSTCRRNLLLRGSQHGVDYQMQTFSSCETLERPEKAGGNENKGCYMNGALKEGTNLQMSYRAMFSSPRILFHPQAQDSFVQHIPVRTGLSENETDKGGKEPPRASDQLQLLVWEQEEARFENTNVHEDLNVLVKWMLHLALTSTGPNVKFEAIANIEVLVMNSEPLIERQMFGPLLCHGAIDLLLKESLSSEIQLQAVRIVHLLLQCPTIIQRFCAEDEGGERMILESKLVNEGDAGMSPHLENQNGKSPVNTRDQGLLGSQTLERSKMAACSAPQQSYYTALSKVKLLEGLTECLKYSDNGRQGYALHRSVIRLLAFIVAFGDSGAAALMHVGASCDCPELGKTCKDDSKLEGGLAAESASGQNVVDDGSGLTHLKGQDLGNKGNGMIPISLVDESVEDSERTPNIPQRLLALIDSELDIEEREEWNEPGIAEERDHLIREAVTLLCRLSSDTVQSPVVIGHLISNKDRTRLTLSVTNRLVSRMTNFKQSWHGQKVEAPRNSDILDLALSLRGLVLRCLEETHCVPYTFE